MLRGLVLLLLVLDIVLFSWIRNDPAWTQSERDPQRQAQQVSPERVTWVPEPASRAGGARAPAVPPPVDEPAAAPAPAVAASSTVADAACLESTPLPPAEATALQRSLASAGVPAAAVTMRADPQAVRWMVYMGRFADATQAQHKAEELRSLRLDYAPVGRPAALAPGLSLGVFTSQANADVRMAELGRRGVHTARVVTLDGDAAARRVQVKPVDAAWRAKLPADRFTACGTP